MRLSVTYGPYPGRFVAHCHNLEHGDTGMTANLELA
jgi:FtsP/CotA-like multicopper oxidase with cupredoxin domain